MTAPVFDIADAVSSAVSASLAELPATDAPATEEGATAQPAEQPIEGEPAPEEEPTDAPDSDEPAVEEESDATPAAELPEGYVAVPSVTDGLVTEFKLLDEEGEVEIPALMVEYKANGKVRKDRLDQVVKLAQWGAYSQEREERLQQETTAKVQEAERLLAEREAQMERLLTDEEFREQVMEAYFAENSPERRAERAEQQITNLRVQQELQTISVSGERFYAEEVEPAVQLIAAALPTVTVEELEAKLEMAMQAQVEVAPNGVPYVPPSRYEAVRKYIVEDLALWAQAAHSRRAKPAVTVEQQKAAKELERAQVAAQKAKREIGRKTQPVGQAGPVKDRPKPTANPTTVDDAVQAALSSALAAFRS